MSDEDKQLKTQGRYHRESREVAARQNADRRQLTRRYVAKIKTEALCVDCEMDYPPYMLQFDHVIGTKIGDVNTLARQGDMARLLAEIEKCEIVCANCHAHRTWIRAATVDNRKSKSP